MNQSVRRSIALLTMLSTLASSVTGIPIPTRLWRQTAPDRRVWSAQALVERAEFSLSTYGPRQRLSVNHSLDEEIHRVEPASNPDRAVLSTLLTPVVFRAALVA